MKMKNSERKPSEELRRNILSDYRDPPARVLPPVPKYELKEKKDVISITELKSNTDIWEILRNLKILMGKKFTNYAELRNRQKDILLNLPHLDAKQLMRQKMDAYDYITLEFLEEELYFAAYFLYHLLYCEEKLLMKNMTFSQGMLLSIRNSPQVIKMLAKILKQLNIYINEDDSKNLVSLAFNSGKYFEARNDDWWWLANEFYNIAVKLSIYIPDKSGYSQALVNYLYGKYLLLKGDNVRKAICSLEIAKTLSKGKDWTVEEITHVRNEDIHTNSSYLLQIALGLEAGDVSSTDPYLAAKLSERAAIIAETGNFHPDLEENMFDAAMYYSQDNKTQQAITILSDLEKLCEEEKNIELYLGVQTLLAKCYLRRESKEEAVRQIAFISQLAEQFDIPWLQEEAKAYRDKLVR